MGSVNGFIVAGLVIVLVLMAQFAERRDMNFGTLLVGLLVLTFVSLAVFG